MNIWQSYKQERDCLVDFLRYLAVCWPGAQSLFGATCRRHTGGTHRLEPSRSPTATLTASSSSLKPQDVIGIAYSQSPLCGEDADKQEAR